MVSLPIRYVPSSLTANDKATQFNMLMKSFKSRPSRHVAAARRIYNVTHVTPNKELATKTGCTVAALKQIIKKGEGAYYSSGSRPNQTAQSWGRARLASSITAGKSAAVDYDVIEQGCNHKKKAFILANQARENYGYGRSRTKRVSL